MEALMERLGPRLSRLFQTRRPVYISTSSATGLMEAAIRNLVAERVLCLVCGAFSRRFHEIAVACGVGADRLDVEWGEANEPDEVVDALAAGDFDAVTMVHSETSTGVLNPVPELAAAVRDAAPEALVIVDCVTSVGGVPVEVDDWGLDFAITGSQKALALPPGLALGVASERALERAGKVPGRGLYFDLQRFESAAAKRQTTNTPAVSLLFALERQLEDVEAEGLEARWDRHRAMAERTHGWVEETREGRGLDLRVLAPESRRSPTVTCVMLPDGLSGREVVRRLGVRGFTIGPGYGELKDRAFRIGHMGDHTVEELEALLGALEAVLAELTGEADDE